MASTGTTTPLPSHIGQPAEMVVHLQTAGDVQAAGVLSHYRWLALGPGSLMQCIGLFHLSLCTVDRPSSAL